jgi:hypothetical protein
MNAVIDSAGIACGIEAYRIKRKNVSAVKLSRNGYAPWPRDLSLMAVHDAE